MLQAAPAKYDRDYHLRRTYGISLEDYERMLEEQGGVCAICSEGCRTGRRLSVDHCHETGRVRGLLCSQCNILVGWIEKREWFARAQEYLA